MFVVEAVPDTFLLFFFFYDFSFNFSLDVALFEVNLGPIVPISDELLIKLSLNLSNLLLLFLCDMKTLSSSCFT